MRFRTTLLVVILGLAVGFGSSCAASYHDQATASIEDERYDLAVGYLEQGAIEGDKRCDHLLATLMLSGALGDGIDRESAVVRLRRAAIADVPGAQSDLGKLYEVGDGVGQDFSTAAEWYHKAALAGVPEAQANLGYLYETGNGVAQDSSSAAEWYEKSAEQGFAFGQGALGFALFRGIGVQKNVVEA